MPPAPSQKGTGKKGGSGIVRQRSRNTTPSAGPPPAAGTANIPPIETIETEFLDLRLESVRSISYEDLADSSASNAVIPDSKSLDGLITRLGKLHDIIEHRGQFCDRGMRLVAGQRKTHFDEMAASGRREEERSREDEEKKANKKKRKANDSLAPQETNAGE